MSDAVSRLTLESGQSFEWSAAMLRAQEEALRDVMRNRETLIGAFVAETGLHPSECELVEQRHGLNVTHAWVRRSGSAYPEAAHEMTLLRSERDELLAMVERLSADYEDGVDFDAWCPAPSDMRAARALIARVKGTP